MPEPLRDQPNTGQITSKVNTMRYRYTELKRDLLIAKRDLLIAKRDLPIAKRDLLIHIALSVHRVEH